jgi:hypothetical protein
MKMTGRFNISSMEAWDEDYVNAEEQAYILINSNGTGEMYFGHVHCELDCRQGKRESRNSIEFTFEGTDEMAPVTGRGWVMEEDNKLAGYICFHMGEESQFTALK